MLKPAFNENKATGLAVFLLNLAQGTMNKMKLIKLMYLIDRASFCETGMFVTNDDFYSLPYGPFLSHTADLINEQSPKTTVWNRYITPPANYNVFLKTKNTTEIEDFLSEYEMKLARSIYHKFQAMNPWDLVDWCHRNLPEWKDPGKGNRAPIDLQIILEDCGKTPMEQKEIFQKLAEQAQIERFFK